MSWFKKQGISSLVGGKQLPKPKIKTKKIRCVVCKGRGYLSACCLGILSFLGFCSGCGEKKGKSKCRVCNGKGYCNVKVGSYG